MIYNENVSTFCGQKISPLNHPHRNTIVSIAPASMSIELSVYLRPPSTNKFRNKSLPDAVCCLQVPNRLLYCSTLEKRMTKRSLVSQMVTSDSIRKDEHSIGVEMPYEFLEGSSLESRMSSKARSLSSQLSHLSKRKREVLLEKVHLIDVKESDIVRNESVLSSLQETVQEMK